jgi:ketosteroid isomerase-like protein
MFAKTVESLDLDRITRFYAPDAYSRVLDRAPRNSTGIRNLRDDVAATLAPVAAIHIDPVGDVRAWKDGDHAWTIQDFHVTGTLKDGRGFAVDVHYSAVWRKAEKKDRQKEKTYSDEKDHEWLVEYEHLMGPPPVARTSPAKP